MTDLHAFYKVVFPQSYITLDALTFIVFDLLQNAEFYSMFFKNIKSRELLKMVYTDSLYSRTPTYKVS